MKKNSYVMYSLTVIILILISSIYFFSSINKPYGNDKESIKEVIRSVNGYENETIEILEIKDLNDTRIVGFLSNNDPAYIEFLRNQKGNYEWRHIQKYAGQSFASDIIHLTDYGPTVSYFMIITNEENNIAKMELAVNEQIIEQELSLNKRAVTLIELPQSKSSSYTFKYKYYDKKGNLIEQH